MFCDIAKLGLEIDGIVPFEHLEAAISEGLILLGTVGLGQSLLEIRERRFGITCLPDFTQYELFLGVFLSKNLSTDSVGSASITATWS